jgi:hypothetical protein
MTEEMEDIAQAEIHFLSNYAAWLITSQVRTGTRIDLNVVDKQVNGTNNGRRSDLMRLTCGRPAQITDTNTISPPS